MGLLPKTEDRPTPKEIYNFRTYLFAAIVSSGAALIGYDSAFIGGTLALSSFEDEFQFDRLSTSKVDLISANIVSCYQAGAFFGALFAYPAGHLLGRKIGLLIFTPIFLVGAAIMLGAAGRHGLGILYGGRVLAGVGIGGISNLTPIYISELSPPAIRGRLVGFYEVGWQIGGLVGFWINVCDFPYIERYLCLKREYLANLLQVRCQQNYAPFPKPVDDSFWRPVDSRWLVDGRYANL